MWKNALLNYCETHIKTATLWSVICGMGQNAKKYVQTWPPVCGTVSGHCRISKPTGLLIQTEYLGGFVADVNGILFQALGSLAAKKRKYNDNQSYYQKRFFDHCLAL